MRQQWATHHDCLLARESHAFYRALGERLRPSVDPGFRECGYLFVAHTEPTAARLRAGVELQNGLGIPSRLLTSSEAGEVAPGLDERSAVAASYCAEDGFVDRPQAAAEAFAEAARRNGVALELGEVTALEPAGERWRLRFGDGSSAEAGGVVVAAAGFSKALLDPLGVELPLSNESRALFYSEPLAGRVLEPLVAAPDRRVAAKQLSDGRLLALDLGSPADPGDPGADQLEPIRAGLGELLPRLAAVPLPQVVRGAYDVTPDRRPLVGQIPGRERLWVAAGSGDHGFMVAPAVGAGLARIICGEPAGEAVAQLSPARFETGPSGLSR